MRFGSLTFERVSDAANYFDRALHTYPLHSPIIGADAEALRDLSVLGGIPQAHGYEVVYDKRGQRRAFAAVQPDGAKVLFHHKLCLRSDSIDTKFSNRVVASAMRLTVLNQIKAYRNLRIVGLSDPFVCPLTERLSEREACTVDHVIPFITLMNNFLAENRTTVEQVSIIWRDGRAMMKDESMREAWAIYHLNNAVVHLTSREGNKERRDSPTTAKGESLFDALAEVLA